MINPRAGTGVFLLLLWSLSASAPAAQEADPAPEVLYADVQAKEKAVRAAFASTVPAPAVVRALRTVVGEYEDLVRRFPAAAFCDDALWNAATLSSDAFKRYGDPHEREANLRLLHQLASEYPESRLAVKVPPAIAASERAVPPAAAQKPARVATISAINREALPGAVRITIELDSEVQFHDERLTNPDRVFVDLLATRLSPALADGTLRFDADELPVRQVRVGRHPNNVTRVVLETSGVSSCSVYSLYGPYRLVVECIPAAPQSAAMPLPARALLLDVTPPAAPADAYPRPVLTARPFEPGWGRSLPGVPSAPAETDLPAVRSTQTASQGAPAPLAAPAPPPANLTGGFSVARQLGLGVSRIVIDPGHGGHDPGAKGNGLTEAEIVLDVALRLEKIFATVPGVEVVLTRRTNEYVSLEERSALANRENADLLLSIHANGSRNTRAGGVETYFLNFAATQDAAAVAARENATSAQAMAALPEVIKAITLHNKRDESRDFAALVQRALVRQLRPANRDLRDLGVKQAPFMVLVGATMPGILTEVSFVTNAQEARLLRNASYRQRIAQALFEATRTYQTSLKGGGVVALQRPDGSAAGGAVAGPQP
jgi:N-acetylmuramoyl-L-alanine amidase